VENESSAAENNVFSQENEVPAFKNRFKSSPAIHKKQSAVAHKELFILPFLRQACLPL
jgi:hypothetical protein